MTANVPAYTFTAEDSLKGATAAAVARQRWLEETRAKAVSELLEIYNGLDLSQVMTYAVNRLLLHMADQELPPLTDAADFRRMAESINILHKALRLELGESTSNVATADITVERLASLKARMAQVVEVVGDSVQDPISRALERPTAPPDIGTIVPIEWV